MKKLTAILVALSILFCGIAPVMVSPVYAGICDDIDKDKDPMYETLGCEEEETIGTVGNRWIEVVLSFVGLAAVIMIIIGGISYVKSMGDPGKARRARDTIIYGVVGLVVCLLAYAIVALVTANVQAPKDGEL